MLRMLFKAVAVEIAKYRRSKLIVTFAALPLFLCATVLLNYKLRTGIQDTPMWSWGIYLQTVRALWAVVGCALLAALLAAFSTGMETRADAWKLLLVQPVPKTAYFWGKLLPLMGLSALSQMLLLAGAVASGWILGLPAPFPREETWTFPAAAAALLPVLALQFWISLRVRSFVLPLGFCLMAQFACIIGSSVRLYGVRPSYYFPWSFPLRALRASGGPAPESDLPIALAMACVIALFSYFDFLRRETP